MWEYRIRWCCIAAWSQLQWESQKKKKISTIDHPNVIWYHWRSILLFPRWFGVNVFSPRRPFQIFNSLFLVVSVLLNIYMCEIIDSAKTFWHSRLPNLRPSIYGKSILKNGSKKQDGWSMHFVERRMSTSDIGRCRTVEIRRWWAIQMPTRSFNKLPGE